MTVLDALRFLFRDGSQEGWSNLMPLVLNRSIGIACMHGIELPVKR